MPVVSRPPRPSGASRLAPSLLVGLVSGAAAAALTAALVRPDPAPAGPAPVPAARVADAAARASPAPPDARSGPAATGPTPAATGERVAALEAALEDALAERSQLAATLVALSREVGELTDAVGAANLPRANGPDPEAGASGAPGGDGGPSADGREANDPLAGFVAAGLDRTLAADLRRREDEWRLARLELVDQAAREGWEDSEEFDARLEALDATRPELREELGDDGFDRYLYESGARNRVRVESIIPGSTADGAGLAPGDVVLGYADARVFAPSDLQDATRGGTRGETVTLEAERDGQRVLVQVPRGPLGITLDRTRAAP